MPAIAIDFPGFFVNGVFTILFSFDVMEDCFQLCEQAFCSRLTLCEQDQVELWGERLMDWARVKACPFQPESVNTNFYKIQSH